VQDGVQTPVSFPKTLIKINTERKKPETNDGLRTSFSDVRMRIALFQE
jgi:hypothetical protein